MTNEEHGIVARSVEARGSTVVEAIATGAATMGVKPSQVRAEVLSAPKRSLLTGTRPALVRVWIEDAAPPATTVEAPGDAPPTAPEEVPPPMAGMGPSGPASAEPVPSEEEGGASATPAPSDVAEATPDDDPPATTPIEEEPVTETNTETTRPDEGGDDQELSPQERLDQLDEEAEIAADFVEGMLDLLSLPGDIEIVVREDQALVNINEVGSGLLIGRRGATLDALQELVRCATQRRTERRSHVRVDVEGYRERQLEKLREKCRDAIAEVREHGEPVRLEPMDPYERKMMHDVVAKAGGVTSTSEGNEPRRRVVIHPAED
ncbi:MAG: RNA-binding cell elongation regulator Jag/EloR [Actinomycetota bacterium]